MDTPHKTFIFPEGVAQQVMLWLTRGEFLMSKPKIYWNTRHCVVSPPRPS